MSTQGIFIFNSLMLGVGLAADAFSVSVTGGLAEPGMRGRRAAQIAGTFGAFQFLMPVAGWVCVRFAMHTFAALQRFIPWTALLLLVFIGGKMLLEGLRQKKNPSLAAKELSGTDLLLLGIATSIDALSVGFAIAQYAAAKAVFGALIIGAVTFVICLAGVRIGSRGSAMFLARGNAGKGEEKGAEAAPYWIPPVAGGIILIGIGIKIFLEY
ncbi:MAG: manganese efflux pump [Lachnospiraceae bacterium]|nr:manganese efflux pump [Lachnospiraceae bacterium]